MSENSPKRPWTIAERAEAFDDGQKSGRGPAIAVGKSFSDHLSAEKRVAAWQKDLRAKKA